MVFGATVRGDLFPGARADRQPEEYVGPCALAVSKDAETLYVACADARKVAWVDLSEGTVTGRVSVPGRPTSIVLTPDEGKLIVTCSGPSSSVALLDSVSGDFIASVPAGHTAEAAAVSPDGKRLYVCNQFNNDLSVIDLVAGSEVGRVPVVREPLAAAVTPDGRSIVVSNHLANVPTDIDLTGDVSPVVTIVDAVSLSTTSVELFSGANGLRGLCVSPDGRYAFVAHLLSNFQMVPFRLDMGWINTNVVSIIDLRQRELVSTIGMDELDLGAANPWDVGLTADGTHACVSLSGVHELGVIDASVLVGDQARRTMSPMMGVWPIYPSLGASLWKRVKLPGNGPRGLAFAGSKVYVAEYFSDTVAEVDLQAVDDRAVRSIALGPKPNLTGRRRGEMLFHDATICYQHWQSCASCHPNGRVDALTWDLLNDGIGNPKSTKSLLLSHQTPPSMAEGVRGTAETAVRSGLANILFAHRPEAEADAIDTYLRSLAPVPSPYLVDGRLSAAAERGRLLFESPRVGCQRCHPAPLYTDLRSHDVGTRTPLARNVRFDTPTLVEVWRTAPYLHDGRYTTIKQLLADGRHGLRGRRGDELSARDIDDLAEFVLSL
jgi:YVTN family beta-propeller protein